MKKRSYKNVGTSSVQTEFVVRRRFPVGISTKKVIATVVTPPTSYP